MVEIAGVVCATLSLVDSIRTVPTMSIEIFEFFPKYTLKYSARLDIMPAVLILADNLRVKNSLEAFNWYC
jgi:hypothetical protein